MIIKRIQLFLILCCCCLMTTAQPPQRQTTSTVEPPRINNVCLSLSGGTNIPFSHLATTKKVGGFGQADIFFFLTENITAGADFAYYFFPGKGHTTNIAMQEVLISGAYYFRSKWNPNISFGLGYYGEPGTSHFGFVPGVGIMPKITNNIYFTAKASVAFFDMDGHFFKIGAGITFVIFRHKPIRK